jgi:anti-sigma factor RsiW
VTCPVVPDVGAYVLGALDPAERQRVEEHLASCPACAAELAELEGLPALLDRVPAGDLRPVAVTPSPELFDRVTAATRPARLRWLLTAAAVLAVLGLGIGLTVAATGGDGPRTWTATAGAVDVTLTATAEGDGTALDVTVGGMRPGETCRLVAVDEDGTRHPAGQWPTTADGGGRWVGWAPVPPPELDAVLVFGDGEREVARLGP